MGKIFTKQKIHKFLSSCLTLKEGVNGNLCLKARGVQEFLFRVSTPKEIKDMNVSLPYIE